LIIFKVALLPLRFFINFMVNIFDSGQLSKLRILVFLTIILNIVG